MIGFKEIQITTPYGQISAKEWGKAPKNHILAIHGWLQNCATYDHLMPLLHENLHVIAIDLPGHGLSSRKPPGCFYNFIDSVIDIKRIVDHFDWPIFSFLGHSLGCSLALMYASIYPETIDKIILLDSYGPVSMPIEDMPILNRVAIDRLIEGERLSHAIGGAFISKQIAYKRIVNDSIDYLSSESVMTLAERTIANDPVKFDFISSRDPRLRVPWGIPPLSDETAKIHMENVKCKLLIIKAKQSKWQDSSDVKENYLRIYSMNCKLVMHIEIEGNHYVHLNNPERVAPIINMFFTRGTLEMVLKGNKKTVNVMEKLPLK